MPDQVTRMTWRNAMKLPWRQLRLAPGAAALFLVSAVAVVWAASEEAVPGTGILRISPPLGAVILVALWAALWATLAVACQWALENEPPRRWLHKLSLCACTGVLTAEVFARTALFDYGAYGKYLNLLCGVGFWFGVLLGRESVTLWRRVTKSPHAGWLLMPVVFLAFAALAVCLTDILIHWSLPTRRRSLSMAAVVANTALLGSLYLVAFGITRRILAAILLASPIYLLLAVATVGKITYMHAAVQPRDLLYLPELAPLLPDLFGSASIIAVALPTLALIAAAISLCRRKPLIKVHPLWRMAGVAAGLALLAGAALSQTTELGRYYALRLGLNIVNWDSKQSAEENGFFLDFITYRADLALAPPANYSPEEVDRRAAKYLRQAAAPREKVNVVLYLVESMIDPRDLGFDLTADPIPTIRKMAESHTSGYAIVPGAFGGSVNTEFELLTGMSMVFLPSRSIPYRQYLRRQTPSVPCLLKEQGYRTIAIQADPVSWFNRAEAYRYLCFEQTLWLKGDPSAPRDVTGRWPSDDAVVDRVIAASQEGDPFFIFAFPASTHAPYNHPDYKDSSLDLRTEPGAARDQAKYYINALHAADRAVGRLLDFFSARREKTLIIVLGDHAPPLPEEAMPAYFAPDSEAGDLHVVPRHYRVPLLIWSNYPRPKRHVVLSTNMLAAEILDQMGVQPPGLLGLVTELRQQLPVLSQYAEEANGARWTKAQIPARFAPLMDTYELLQYDLLQGETDGRASLAQDR